MTRYLVFILILLFVAALPIWPYSEHRSFHPSGILAILIVITTLLIARRNP